MSLLLFQREYWIAESRTQGIRLHLPEGGVEMVDE